MKKIIAAFDGLKYSVSTRQYALYIAKQSNTHLVGVFLDDFAYHNYKIYDLIDEKTGVVNNKRKLLEAKDTEMRKEAVADFEKNCQLTGINYTIHHDRSVAIQELLHESIYADLLILNSHESLSNYNKKTPSDFIRDVLANAQCPVLLIPKKYKPIEKIILLYDGEPSSVYAVKMFSYILNSLKHHPTEIVTVNLPNQSLHIPENKLMKEFTKRHFPKATYKVLKGLPEYEIVNYLKLESENALVVLGAYHRNKVSRFFKQSLADILIRELKFPLFIAHHK
jgi:hypothetical protein